MKDIYLTEGIADAIPTETRGRQGLCTFCYVAPGCALIKASGMPVSECEEFRATDQPQGRAGHEDNVRDARPTDKHSTERKDHTNWSQKGLCGNCAIYETCPFSKDEGGIWHCEEYR